MKTKIKLLAFGIFLADLAWLVPTVLAQSLYEPYTFTTLAGNAGNGSDDGIGSSARFYAPSGVTVDSAGSVYVADSSNHTIRKVTPTGVVTTLAGLAGGPGYADGTGSAARFFNPVGVAADGAGNVYVADAGSTIRKVTPTGVVSTLAGLAGSGASADGTGIAARFNNPRGVAVDSAGNVFVADTWNYTIRKVTPAGVVTTLAGLAGSVGSADGTGNSARFANPSGVAVDNAGNIYVADSSNHTIRKVTPTGVVTTLAGLAGSPGYADGKGSAARFNYPQGVAVDSAGKVYVADLNNHTIRKVTEAGVVTTTLAADGTGSAAWFDQPYGVAVDSAGNVYVADLGNSTIRKGLPVGPPLILTQPQSQSVEGSYTVNFSVLVARGATPGISMAQGRGADLAGATNTSYSIANVRTNDAGVYSVVSTNVFGGVISSNTTLTVFVRPPLISTQPQSQTVGTSYNVTLGVAADGTPSLAYQWRKDGVNIAGASDPSYSIAYVQNLDAGFYSVVVSNPYGSVTSSDAELSVTMSYTFTTLAGNAGEDGTGSAARFNDPEGVAVDSAGNVYVADSNNHTIRKVTSGGVATTLAGRALSYGSADGTGSAARFNFPTGLAVDSAGNVYVADSGNNTIRKVTPGGVVTTLAGLADNSGSADGTGSDARFNSPTGVALDGASNVYVADSYNNAIRKVTPAGAVTTLAGLAQFNTNGVPVAGSADGTGSHARFYYPHGVAVDSAGNLYVAYTGNNTIRKVTPGGVVTTPAGLARNFGNTDGTGSAARFSGPTGVAVDSAGNLYVADHGNSTIRKVNPTGVVTTLAGLAGNAGNVDGTGSDAQFYAPSGVTVDSTGSVYVADSNNHTIRKVTPTGVVTTLAGLAGQMDSNGNPLPGSADGTGSTARFNYPQGVAVDGASNVYVADTYNSTIRKVTPTGVVTTLAGLPPQYDNDGNFVTGGAGSADGTGSAARFSTPSGVAVDSVGNVYVADSGNDTIRKVTLTGVVTTLAGNPFIMDQNGIPVGGSADGTGSAAQFWNPAGVAVDSASNVYVADTYNNTIRKVTPAGVVTTLAGLAGEYGSADGTGDTARFNHPSGVAVDSAGNVYVADEFNATIRKVTPAGVVTTLAGLAAQFDNDGNLVTGGSGSADGTGSAARFGSVVCRLFGCSIRGPTGVAVDSGGNVYVADRYNATIRKVTPAGVVTTLAGLADRPGSTDGTGSAARFGEVLINFDAGLKAGPTGVAVDSAGNVYVVDTANNTIRKGYPENVPVVIVTSAPGFGFSGGQFGFNLTGPAGRSVVVEASTDLVSWLPLWTNTFAGAFHFSDPQSGVYSNRFYRAHIP